MHWHQIPGFLADHINVVRRQNLVIDQEIIESNQRRDEWHNRPIVRIEVARNLVKNKKQQSAGEIAEVLTSNRLATNGTISVARMASEGSQRFFSPFPRGTCPLSVANEYLGLGRGRRRFIRSFTFIVLLRKSLGVLGFSGTGFSPLCILTENEFA